MLAFVRNAINLHTTSIKIHKMNYKKQPWLTRGLLNSIKTKNKMYKWMLKGRCLKFSYKECKNKLTTLLRVAKKNYFISFANEHRKNAKAMWSLINKCIGRGFNKCSALADMNPIILNNYFVESGPNAVKNLKTNVSFRKYLKNGISESIFLSPVNDYELMQCVNTIASKHSKGCDGLSVYTLKQIISCIVSPLTKIINKIYLYGIVPDFCKIAEIVPVFKSGDVSDYKNYRPISILPAISKLFEKLTLFRLSSFLT